MKIAHYNLTSGGTLTVEYDENAPCVICGQPVTEASMGGTNVCPWCDIGFDRRGRKKDTPVSSLRLLEKPNKPIKLPSFCPGCGSEKIDLELKLDNRVFITCQVCQQTSEKILAELVLERELSDDDV